MIKVKSIFTSNDEKSVFNKFSKNNDGVFNDIIFVGLEVPDSQVDYIIVGDQYVMVDREFYVDKSKLWNFNVEPYVQPVLNTFNHRHEFAKVLSYKGDSVVNGEFMELPSLTWFDVIPRRELEERPYIEKQKNLCWVTSSKIDYAGHIERKKLIEKLYNSKIIDLYGQGFEYVKHKIPVIEKYKYCIAMENTIREDWYITEKICDVFLARTMPFYFGTDKITKMFPEKSMIRLDIDDKFLVEKIKEISESDLYLERMPYIEEARELVLNKWNLGEVLAEKVRQDYKLNPTVNRQNVFVKGVHPKNNYLRRLYFKMYSLYLDRKINT